MSEPRWVKFVEIKEEDKTIAGKVWAVSSKGDGTLLGLVEWFTRWRCYTFCPQPETVFSDECLRDIADFLALLATRLAGK